LKSFNMPRHPTGDHESLKRSQELMRAARTAEELRAAQAVLMPLIGYTLDDTAAVLGRSRHWVSRVRNSTMRGEEPPGRHGGRRWAAASQDEEISLVRAAIVKNDWYSDRKPLRTYLRDALDGKLKSPPSESTLTAILDRAAIHFLGDKLARGTDLEWLSQFLARIWHSQDYIANHMKRLRSKLL
jgi:Homeodomain-like domain